jgi:hypothetical protein
MSKRRHFSSIEDNVAAAKPSVSASMPEPHPEARLRELLDLICQDSLETTLAATLAEREWAMKQEVSSLFVEASDALDVLVGRLEHAEAEVRHYREHGRAGTCPFERCQAVVCLDAREALGVPPQPEETGGGKSRRSGEGPH